MTPQAILHQAMEKHKTGDMESARILYEKILSNDPTDPDALNLLGVLHLQHGDLEHAHGYIQRAIEIDPGIAEYHHNLGQVLKRKGDINAANECFRQSLRINPGMQIEESHPMERITDNEIIGHGERRMQKEMKRYEVIQHVINQIKGRTYLEIGIDSGESFFNVKAARKIGIDPVASNLIHQIFAATDIEHFSYSTSHSTNLAKLSFAAESRQPIAHLPTGETADFYCMTSDLFFSQKSTELFCSEKIDVAFIDGLHTYEQVCKDVHNILSNLSEKGVILIHDCNPPSSSSAFPAASWEDAAKMQLPGWTGLWCGDVWKSIVYLRSTRKDLNIFVLDCDFGLGVVSLGKPNKVLDFSEAHIKSMSYDSLKHNRQEMLNLRPQEYLFDFLNTSRWNKR